MFGWCQVYWKSTAALVLANRFDPSVLVQGDAFFGFIELDGCGPNNCDFAKMETEVQLRRR